MISSAIPSVIDGLRRPEFCGGIAEVAKGLWMRHEDINVEKLVRSATQLKVGAVMRRLGYLLELYDIAPTDKLNQLRSGLTRTYDLLDPVLPRGGKYTKRWLLQLNVPAEELHSIRRT
jgi:predicted transcriptional regulator of viral defense system